jgi:ceramide synthetase
VAFYLSLSFSHFFEARRKDFWQMFIHHMITLTLLSVSWSINAIRGGSLIVFVHDIADVLLEASKAAKYARYEKTCKAVFVAFILTWIATRLGVFSKIVYCGIFDFPTIYPRYPLYYALAILNIFLLILHILWTYMIIQVIVRMFKTNDCDDVRSSTEDEIDSDEDEKLVNGKSKVNGNSNKNYVE